jgi:hypothetical protein
MPDGDDDMILCGPILKARLKILQFLFLKFAIGKGNGVWCGLPLPQSKWI